MTRRNNTRRTALTSSNNPQTERVAKRLARQQKHLEKDLLTANPYLQPSGYAAKGRPIKFGDIKQLEPLTDTQSDFFEAYENNDADAFVLYGSAGTGKSFLGMYFALQDVLMQESVYKKIILVRSSVQSREQGHLPGSADEKMEPFEEPYHNICSDLLGRKDAYEKLKDTGILEFHSSSFLRGSTFDNAIVVVDECQNFKFSELSTVITRLGKNSKIIICGDGAQNDLTTNKNDISGFRDFLVVSKNMPEFRHFKFTTDDIVRSAFVKSWLVQCERLGL